MLKCLAKKLEFLTFMSFSLIYHVYKRLRHIAYSELINIQLTNLQNANHLKTETYLKHKTHHSYITV